MDGIRVFNEDTQRSIDIRDDISILPAVIRGERSSSILSYLNRGRIFYDEPQRCEEELKKYFHEEAENKEKAFDWAGLVKTGRSGRKYRNREILFSFLKRDADLFKVKETATWKGRTMVNYQRQISLFFNDLTRLLKEGWSAVILTPRRSERKELEQYLSDYHVPVSQKVQKEKLRCTMASFPAALNCLMRRWLLSQREISSESRRQDGIKPEEKENRSDISPIWSREIM